MKPDIKEKWVTALRSGDYKQGKGRLRTVEGHFCCLGVLCDIWAKETETEWNLPGEGELWGTFPGVTPQVQVWAGIETVDVKIALPEGGESWASNLNDVGTTFEVLADLIEEQL